MAQHVQNPCALLAEAQILEGIVAFNDETQFETPEAAAGWAKLRIASLDLVKVARTLARAILEGDTYDDMSPVRQRFHQAIAEEERATSWFGKHICS